MKVQRVTKKQIRHLKEFERLFEELAKSLGANQVGPGYQSATEPLFHSPTYEFYATFEGPIHAETTTCSPGIHARFMGRERDSKWNHYFPFEWEPSQAIEYFKSQLMRYEPVPLKDWLRLLGGVEDGRDFVFELAPWDDKPRWLRVEHQTRDYVIYAGSDLSRGVPGTLPEWSQLPRLNRILGRRDKV